MRRALGVAALTLVTACTPGADAGRVARSTLVIERVGTLVKRQNLVLSPLNIVMLTDGIPDTRSEKNDSLSKYKKINVSGLEYLSKNTTVRILYPRPTVAVHWEKNVPRRRVR